MFVNVETFLFNTLVNTQAMQLLDAVEQGETTSSSPKVNDENTEALCTEESPTVTVERTIGSRKQTCHQGAENTADTMYAGCTDRVVNMQFVVNELNSINENDTTDETNNDCSYRRYEIATGGDTYKTCQHTVQCQ